MPAAIGLSLIRLALSLVSSHCVDMSRTGRHGVATREQREEVLRLIEAGTSRRQVAHEVFGDERLRGRVDRILQDADPADAHAALERALEQLGESLESEENAARVPVLEELFPLYARSLQRRLQDPSERVTASELQTFARLELWVENKRRVAELNDLTRGSPG